MYLKFFVKNSDGQLPVIKLGDEALLFDLKQKLEKISRAPTSRLDVQFLGRMHRDHDLVFTRNSACLPLARVPTKPTFWSCMRINWCAGWDLWMAASAAYPASRSWPKTQSFILISVLLAAPDSDTSEWIMWVTQPICPPNSCVSFIHYFDKVWWCFTIPIPNDCSLCRIFKVLEKQNVPLDTSSEEYDTKTIS